MDILSLLGMNIHDEKITAKEDDASSPYDRSYKAFLRTAHGVTPRLEKVELPAEKKAYEYAQVYFGMINPYLPILHKANFISLVRHIHAYEPP